MGCSDLPLVNFSEPWHKHKDLNLFKEIPVNYQNIIKESVVITLSKNKLLFGVNNKFKHKEIEEFDYIIENFDNIGKLYNGNMKNRVKHVE